MSLDVEKLLAPLDGEDPCGIELDYEPEYAQMDDAIAGREEQEMGDSTIPGEPPNFGAGKKFALSLFEKGKDLHVAVGLATCAIHADGLPGLRDGMLLLKGLIERHWEHVWPKLDPDDGNDPMQRVNELAAITVGIPDGKFVGGVREMPLCESRQIGRFSFRDILIARGELAHSGDGDPPNLDLISAAFQDTDEGWLTERAAMLEESIGLVDAFDQVLTSAVGASNAANFDDLKKELRAVQHGYQELLAARGIGAPPAPEGGPASGGGGGGAAPAQALAGEVNTREDVLRALDKIRKYYQQQEPSSPVPVLLERVQRLVSLDFIGALEDLNPSIAQQIRDLCGVKPPQ